MPTAIQRLTVSPVMGWWMVGVVAAILLGLLFVGPNRDKATRGQRATLLVLRLLVILLLLFAMLRPTLVYTKITKQAATLLVLVDQTRSMLVTDMVAHQSRWTAAKAALTGALPAMDELADDLEIKVYAFDTEPHTIDYSPGKLELPDEPTGVQTALGASLDQVLKSQAGKRLAGVVLLSDGAQRAYAPHDLAPQAPARRMADLGYRLYAVPFGQGRGPGQTRDIALEELLSPQTVFVKNALTVTATARFDGLENQQVQMQLLAEKSPGQMEVVASRQISARQDGERVTVELEYTPETPGEIKITARIEPQKGELVTTNNEISTFVTVLKGGLSVLYLFDGFANEQKWLRWSLGQSLDIHVDPRGFRADKPETRPPDLAELLEPGKVDVYILGDLDATAFKPQELDQLAQTVERGAGLIMLGGLHSFGPGGYGDTALAGVLPIEIGRLERQNLGERIREDLHLPGPLRMRPAANSAAPSLTRLAPGEQNAAAWSNLPALDGANRFSGVKVTGSVVAESQQGQPLLVAGEYGLGRVLAFAGDSTWHWWMTGHEAEHKRFWRQAVLWLARKDESTEGNVWIKLDRRRYSPGERIEFTAGANDAQGDPLTDAKFEAEVVWPDGKRSPVRLRRELHDSIPNMAGTVVETGPPGDYTLVVTATHPGETLGSARARFLVFEQDLELNNPAADVGALESLAAMTSGKRVDPEKLSGLLAEIKAGTKDLEVETQSKKELWDKWPFFITFIVLLIVEWYLRKRWGLV